MTELSLVGILKGYKKERIKQEIKSDHIIYLD